MKSSRAVTGVWRLAILAVVLALGLSAQVALADGTVTVTKAIKDDLTEVNAGGRTGGGISAVGGKE